MNVEDYKFRAEPDFIDVRIVLQRPSHGAYISGLTRDNETGKKCYADPIDPGLAGESRIFDIRFQDPQKFATLKERVDLLIRRLNSDEHFLSAEPEVRRLELAFDIYPKTPDEASIASIPDLIVELAAGIQTPAGPLVRIYDRSFCEITHKLDDLKKHLLMSRIIGIGNRDSSHFQRAYFKRVDTIYDKKSSYVDLPREQWRARFENNYSGDKLGITTMDELKNLNFYSFAKNFSFRYLDEKATNCDLISLAHQQYFRQVGEKGPRRSETASGRKVVNMTRRGTRANLDLNRKAGQALRALTNRW